MDERRNCSESLCPLGITSGQRNEATDSSSFVTSLIQRISLTSHSPTHLSSSPDHPYLRFLHASLLPHSRLTPSSPPSLPRRTFVAHRISNVHIRHPFASAVLALQRVFWGRAAATGGIIAGDWRVAWRCERRRQDEMRGVG